MRKWAEPPHTFYPMDLSLVDSKPALVEHCEAAIVRDPLVSSPDTPLIDAITQMQRAAEMASVPVGQNNAADSNPEVRAACVVVVDGGQIVGLLSERDIVRVTAEQQRLVASSGTEENPPKVGQAMAQPVVTLQESALTDLFSAIAFLKQHRIRCLPLLNEQGGLVGLLTQDSLQQALSSLNLSGPAQSAPYQQLHQELKERRQIEGLLFESEQRYASLTAAAPVGIYRTDVTGRCIYVNDRYCQIIGLPLEAIMGLGWQQAVHPDDRDHVMATWQPDLLPANCFCSLEYRFQHADGSIVWVYDQIVSEKNADGQITGYVGTITDISDRKRAELALQQSERTNRIIVETIPDLLIQVNVKTRYSRLLRSGQAQVSHPLLELREPKMDGAHTLSLQEQCLFHAVKAIETHSLQIYEHTLDVNQEQRYEEVSVSPLNAQNVLIIVRDITHRKQAERQLQNLMEATAATTGRDFFPAFVIHITEALGVSHAMVAEKVGDQMQTLAFWADSALQPSCLYDLTHTPYKQVLQEGMFYCEDHIQEQFPEDLSLVDMDVESCLGLALHDSQGNIIGHLCVLNKQPIQNPQRAEDLLRVFAARAAAELERQRARTSLERLNQQLEANVKERTARLQEREQFLQTVLDTFPLSIFWKDRNSVYRGCNRNFLNNAGLASSSDIIGKTDYDLPWNRSEAEAFRAHDQEVMDSGRPKIGIIETQLQASGHQVWLETNKLPLYDLAGEVVGILGTYQDITERKQAEAQVRSLLHRTQLLNLISSEIRDSLDLDVILQNSVNAIVVGLSADICTFAWHQGSEQALCWEIVKEQKTLELPSWQRSYQVNEFPKLFESILKNQFYRVDDLKELTDLPLKAFLERVSIKAFLCLPIHTIGGKIGSLQIGRISSEEPWRKEEIELLQAIGNQVAIAIYQAQLYEESQVKTREIKRSYQELKETQLQLIQSEKMSSLGQLVAGIAHEINNPMSFIYGNLSVASKYANDLSRLIETYRKTYPTPADEISALSAQLDIDYTLQDFPKLLTSMETGTTRIRDIVKSLRTFSRLDRADYKAVDIHENIDITLVILQNRLNGRAGKQEIQVNKEYGDLPLIQCYGSLLNQVFMNLLTNAIDAIEARQLDAPQEYSGCITITTAIATTPQRNKISVVIQDNGIGMDSETKSKIFDPFFTTKPVGFGTGMGLPISYQIVTVRHQGQLRCHSIPGQGTRFTVELWQTLQFS